MPTDEAFDAMADSCILAGQAVTSAGSDDLRAAMRVMLGVLGREIADRVRAPQQAEGGVARPRATRLGKDRPSRATRRVRFVPCS